jgi:hypothetical protein
MASKAVEGEQKGGKYPAEKKPVKTKAQETSDGGKQEETILILL